jgi:hypothetical protein
MIPRHEEGSGLTAKDPGAFRAAVHPHPRYSAKPSSDTIFKKLLDRNASGFVLVISDDFFVLL